ncbi:hypothetical protein SYN63AY4M2_10770 [Synechococcus sp. 63AY4M2]|nr:hypothetical protein CYA_2129 [Synechococcus sp. JA-3-3Ab]PIK87504.1 hypothetical protein SYN63AY4M2_10770 [Synechococcus sp. 63AY4M2]PIK89638.1 hypothetical protein SYN65AY6A5_01030 [Synechococcus sp. 65AY6A5]
MASEVEGIPSEHCRETGVKFAYRHLNSPDLQLDFSHLLLWLP